MHTAEESPESESISAVRDAVTDQRDEPFSSGWMRKSPLFVFIASAASLGLYVPYWVFGVARRRPGTSVLAAHPKALGWASLAPPFASLVLCQVLIDLRGEHVGPPQTRLRAFAVAWVHFLLAIVFAISQLGDLWGTAFVLLAIPIAMVQKRINQSLPQQEGGSTTGLRRAMYALLLLFGAGLLGAVFWGVDAPAGRTLTSASLRANERIESSDGAIAIRSPGDAWVRPAAGTVGDEDSILELVDAQAASWIVIYAHGAELSLEGLTASRMSLLEEGVRITAADSRLYFWQEESLDRALRSSFTAGDGRILTEQYEILTLEHGGRLFEVIAYTSRRPGDRPDLDGVLESVEFIDE